ncbi:MAG: response regulator, partial [Gemmatimonadales bacterium]
MTSPFRVVLIDDDPDLRQLIKVTLEFTAGWEVATAGNGADGIELVRKLNPDAVVADIMMPEMDGYEVCHRLKQDPRSATIPVVLLTARKELDDALIESS